jgi:RimJ/RimL family protein N-acetyltransferase
MLPRKLSYLDRNLLSIHLLALSPEDRRLRFGVAATDEYIKKYVQKSIDDPSSQWFAIEVDSMLVAVCHAAIYENGEAELGFSVHEEYRNEGYAQILFDRAVTWLRSNGVANVFMHCLSENAAMRHIAKKNRMVVVTDSDESNAKVTVEPPTPLTSVADAYLDRIAVYDMFYKNSYRILKNMFV